MSPSSGKQQEEVAAPQRGRGDEGSIRVRAAEGVLVQSSVFLRPLSAAFTQLNEAAPDGRTHSCIQTPLTHRSAMLSEKEEYNQPVNSLDKVHNPMSEQSNCSA